MPTTCGYPNCKFRSRYRGQEDNRHFYRIPKRPAVLRQAWLNAIGRNEETVVSQLRICSAHFFGGEKHEGDIPVADPQIDTPKFIELPPKESRTAERKSRLKALSSAPPSTNIITTISSPSLLINSQRSSSSTSTLNQNSSISRHSRRGYRTHFGLPFNQRIIRKPSFNSHLNFGNLNSNLFNSASDNEEKNSLKNLPFPQINNLFPNKLMLFNSIFGVNNHQHQQPPLLPQLPLLPQPPQISLLPNKSPTTQTNILTNNLPTDQLLLNNIQKPLVALLDGRDCSVEMPLLKDVATVAFCDAQSINDIHEKVLNEATVALLYQSISLGREEFNKFKSLKAVIRIGPGYNNIDINAATELGIAICHTPVECVEENADSAISLILNLFRKTFSLCNYIQNGKKIINIDQISELMNGSQRIRGSTLGIVGMGSVGIAVALRAKSFGFRVLFYDNNLALGMENALGMEKCSNLTELFSQSDCLTLHCPLTSENKHLINLETIKYLKFGAFLVNTTEFDLIESNSLISALKNGNIRSFAMDCDQPKNIFEKENYDILCSMPNVICTPKIGWYCQESHNELRVAAAQEVRRALTGSIPEDLKNCVNKSELLTLKGIFKINQESLNNSSTTTSNNTIFSKESFNNISPIFPPLLNMQASSLKNCFVNSPPNIFSNNLFQKQLNNIHTKLLNPLNNFPPNFLLMNPNLLQTFMQMRNLQKQTKLEENCAESSSTCKTENDEKEEINEENLVTNDKNLEEINENNNLNKNLEIEETEIEDEKYSEENNLKK